MKFKTIFVDVLLKKELHPTRTHDEAFFMDMNQMDTMLKQLKTVSNHVSFSLFYDVNEHPNVEHVLTCANEHGFRYDITLLSNAFLKHLSMYNTNNLALVKVCVDALEQSASLSDETSINEFVDGLSTLLSYQVNIQIELPSKKKEYYQATTLTFLEKLGIDLSNRVWQRGMLLKLSDKLTVTCCERMKEPVDHPLPKKILGRCHGAVTMLGVLGDGTLIPCNHHRGEQIVLGNLFEMPLVDILSKEPFLSISEGFYKNQLVHPVCQHCAYPRKIF